MTQIHDDWTPRLSEYLDGELSAQEQQALESHVEGCESCRNSLRELSSVVTRLRDSAAEPSVENEVAAMWPHVAASLPERASHHAVRSRTSPSVWPARLVAAGLLVTIGFAGGAWFGRAQCTGAIPWNSSAWVKEGLASLGIGATATARTPRMKRDATPADSVAHAPDSSEDTR